MVRARGDHPKALGSAGQGRRAGPRTAWGPGKGVLPGRGRARLAWGTRRRGSGHRRPLQRATRAHTAEATHSGNTFGEPVAREAWHLRRRRHDASWRPAEGAAARHAASRGRHRGPRALRGVQHLGVGLSGKDPGKGAPAMGCPAPPRNRKLGVEGERKKKGQSRARSEQIGIGSPRFRAVRWVGTVGEGEIRKPTSSFPHPTSRGASCIQGGRSLQRGWCRGHTESGHLHNLGSAAAGAKRP